MKHIICGLDEAGRGALTGPLVAAAVSFTQSLSQIERKAGMPLRDSKRLSLERRLKLMQTIYLTKSIIYIEIISARTINNHGIGWANREIFRRLIRIAQAHMYIVDGNINVGRITGKTDRIISLTNADNIIPEVMAAGIVAKVTRDQLMQQLHQQFPVYMWLQNSGYGTKQHIAAIKKFGYVRYHRLVFVQTAIATANIYK